MGIKSFLSRVFLLTLALIILSTKLLYSQSLAITEQKFQPNDSMHRIKWTKQLPVAVRKAFNNSRYSAWFIEKMISYSKEGKTEYAFYLNNSSLLDGDHYDHLLKKSIITVSSDGTIVQDKSSDQH